MTDDSVSPFSSQRRSTCGWSAVMFSSMNPPTSFLNDAMSKGVHKDNRGKIDSYVLLQKIRDSCGGYRDLSGSHRKNTFQDAVSERLYRGVMVRTDCSAPNNPLIRELPSIKSAVEGG